MAACAAADVGPRFRAAAPSGESWQRIKPTRSVHPAISLFPLKFIQYMPL